MRHSKSAVFGLVVFYCAIYLPIAVVILFSFNDSRFGGRWAGFTTLWYLELAKDQSIRQALWTSVEVAVEASGLAVLIGTPLAYGLYQIRRKGRASLGMTAYSPLLLPDIAVAVGLATTLGLLQLQRGVWSIVVSHATFLIAYTAVVVSGRLATLPPTLSDAARDLGASEFQVFWLVVLPQLRTPILGAFFLCAALSFDDFILAFFTSGVGATTLPVKVFSMIRFGVSPEINALCTLLTLVSLLGTGIVFSLQRGVAFIRTNRGS